MKKVLPIVLVLAVVAVGAWYFLGRKSGGESGQGETVANNLKDIVQKNVPTKCEWRQDDANHGTTWVKGQKIYSEFTSQGKVGYLIFKDNCSWTWDANGQGAKFCFEQVNYDDLLGGNESEAPGATEMVEEEAAPELKCSPAVIADSKFEVPTDVKILDTQELLQQFGTQTQP